MLQQSLSEMKPIYQFIISSLIFFLVQLPMILISFPVVAIMLLTKWDGKTTWFGNFKYGRGDTHYKAPSNGVYLRQWKFLCVRNPVSNFGKKIISVKETRSWAWLRDDHIAGDWFWKYGWKNPVPENDNLRTFVFRPWKHN